MNLFRSERVYSHLVVLFMRRRVCSSEGKRRRLPNTLNASRSIPSGIAGMIVAPSIVTRGVEANVPCDLNFDSSVSCQQFERPAKRLSRLKRLPLERRKREFRHQANRAKNVACYGNLRFALAAGGRALTRFAVQQVETEKTGSILRLRIAVLTKSLTMSRASAQRLGAKKKASVASRNISTNCKLSCRRMIGEEQS